MGLLESSWKSPVSFCVAPKIPLRETRKKDARSLQVKGRAEDTSTLRVREALVFKGFREALAR